MVNADILKLSSEWARAELFSAKIIWLFSLLVLLSSAGFAYWGKTASAKAFVIPLLVSGIVLIAIGVGLYAANKPRITQFEKEYNADPKGFVEKEIQRTTKSEKDFVMVFKILPTLMILGAILLLLVPSVNWRTISIVIVITVAFLMAVDMNTNARNAAYRESLLKHNE